MTQLMTNDIHELITGADLRSARISLGLNQAELGEQVGRRNSTISRAEKSDRVNPDLALAVECLLRRRASIDA